MKKAYKSSEQTGTPFSGAVEAEGLLFISGQVHTDASGKLAGDTIEEKFALVIANIEKVLKEAGLTLEDVIRVQLYLTDIAQLPALNTVYGNYFSHPLPARTSIGVAALPIGASLEMDAVAKRN